MEPEHSKHTKILSKAEQEKLERLIDIIEEAAQFTDEINAILKRLFDSGVRFSKKG